MRKTSLLIVMLLIAVVLFSGCTPAGMQKEIDPNNGIWDKFFVNPLSISLDYFAKLVSTDPDNSKKWNYGISILITTIIIRLLTLPLMLKQIKSSKAMQAIQPELQKVREKFKDNQQKIQEETMKLFQKNNVNPLAGCLPLVVQMPVLIAFYHAIMRNDHIAAHNFLWLNLGTPDPIYLLPVLAAITTFVQQKMMSAQMNQQMKILLYIMPAMILFIAVSLPSALSLYWVYGNVFTIIQTYFIYNRQPMAKREGATK